jgi:hypothetical protein
MDTANPLAESDDGSPRRRSTASEDSADSAGSFEIEDKSEPAVGGGRVNIKDLLLDARAHGGVNSAFLTLVVVVVGFKFLGQLADTTFSRNNVQLKEWALPVVDDIQDARKMADFAHRWYSRLLDDPVVDGHNRALMAYLGTAGTTGSSGLWPDEACELGSPFPDSSGRVLGRYPSEPGKEYPFESYRLPCMRELHYKNGDYHENEDDLSETRGEVYGSSHFSDPVLMGKYNFSAVMHWHNHDYPLIYAASVKDENISHIRAAIDQASAFIAQQDPMDIRMGLYLYNPATATVAEVEMQFFRTYGTAHRTAGVLLNTFSATGRESGYWLWVRKIKIRIRSQKGR